ncbi:hypothetical protein [Streptomyces lydicus]|uniref:hypothetical protein n=1 Tax=Streptomyces lydicus TaxID=47763 RepID=UPI0013E2B4EF|nr:hypothetical protein [Streptomyces lydicus]
MGSTRFGAWRLLTAGNAALMLSFADWSPERLNNFIADLQQFNHDIERLAGRPWPR